MNDEFNTERVEDAVRPFRPLGRRRFLQAGAATVVAGSLGAQAGCSSAAAPRGLAAIGEDWAVLEKFAHTILPVDGDARFVNIDQVPVFENVNALLSTLEPDMRSDLGKGLMLFNYASIVLGFHFRRFVGLDSENAVAYVRRWESGNQIQRGLMWALKQIVYVSYWQIPETWPAIEYDGPVTAKHGIPRLGNAPLPHMEATP